MTPTQFVFGIRETVVRANNEIYGELFANTSPIQASDEHWQRALTLFNKLSNDEKETFLKTLKQVSVDTVSNVFGVLDGLNDVDGSIEPFTLLDGAGTKLNGDLQALFLESEEGPSA
jgi:hypothetical protein